MGPSTQGCRSQYQSHVRNNPYITVDRGGVRATQHPVVTHAMQKLPLEVAVHTLILIHVEP